MLGRLSGFGAYHLKIECRFTKGKSTSSIDDGSGCPVAGVAGADATDDRFRQAVTILQFVVSCCAARRDGPAVDGHWCYCVFSFGRVDRISGRDSRVDLLIFRSSSRS
jgi:hypothetical protein